MNRKKKEKKNENRKKENIYSKMDIWTQITPFGNNETH